MDVTEILTVCVSEVEQVDDKLEEPVVETIIIEAVVPTTEIIAEEVSVSETDLVNDQIKVLFIPKPLLDVEPTLTEEKLEDAPMIQIETNSSMVSEELLKDVETDQKELE